MSDFMDFLTIAASYAVLHGLRGKPDDAVEFWAEEIAGHARAHSGGSLAQMLLNAHHRKEKGK